MELASVTRLFRDQTTHKATLLLEAVGTKEKFRITLPGYKAGILALESHGLNDRCGLYGVLSECVDLLGGSFTSVIVTLDKTSGVSAALSISSDEELRQINADVVELVAFALHVQIPIFLDVADSQDESSRRPEQSDSDLPIVFENVLTEIMYSKSDSRSTTEEDDEQHS